MSFLYELQRTLATMALLPWSVVRLPGSPSNSPAVIRTENESLRWVVIQIFVLYAFYRLFTPLLSLKGSGSRAYSKARIMMDAWLLLALAIHTPSLHDNFNSRPTRLFASVFALFLVASHLALAVFTLLWHFSGWITRTFWPSIVDTLWLPSGQKWKSPSMGNLVRFSLVLSLFTSLVFVGCTIEAQQTPNPIDLPMVCRGGWYTSTDASEDGSTIHHQLGILRYIGQFSLLNSPVGVLWQSGLALFVIYYTSRKSTRLSLRARFAAAMRLEDFTLKADAVFQTEVEDGYLTEPSTSSKYKEVPQFLEMCEWYSLAVFDTAVQLLISLKLFFGRFDLRLLKRPDFGAYARVISIPSIEGPNSTVSLASSLMSSPSIARQESMSSPFRMARANTPLDHDEQQHATKSHQNNGITTEEEEEDFVFDWMADTGDGGHSTYQVARWLAKPVLYVRKDASTNDLLKDEPRMRREIGDLILPRGRLLLIGGDLVYPDPSVENMDRRLFQPFEDAMEPPPSFRKSSISVLKREGDAKQRQVREVIPTSNSTAPVCYCLAGNHDHFDGLQAFYRCIVDRDWLGGWRLPQTSSYFTIKLTHGWWIFALDQALGEDIDSTQLRYFEHMATTQIGPNDRVIVASHEPIWLYDAYCENAEAKSNLYKSRAPLVKELLLKKLKGKVALRICGDLHNYMRYEEDVSSKRKGERLNLVISGGGGAFLHPTHCFPKKLSEANKQYKLVSCYPDVKTSRRLALENLGSGFRLHNWRFDFVGASVYFLLCVSLFPRCGVKSRVVDSSTGGVPSYFYNYGAELISMVHDSFTTGVISPSTMVLAVVITLLFADGEKGTGFQIRLGLAHGLAHILFALTAFMMFQITVETAIVDGLAGSSFYSLFESYLETERGAVPQAAWTDAYFLTTIREILRGFDMPEAVAVPHAIWCRESLLPSMINGTALLSSPISLSRYDTAWFYFSSYSYLYVLSADLVALVIGIYLAASSSVFFVHWNESFSSLRHRHLKNFVRFRIDKVTGDLHAFVLGIDRVPLDLMVNTNYETTTERMKRLRVHEEQDPRVASFGASLPSKWIPTNRRDALTSKPRLVDYFVVRRHPASKTN